MWGSLKTSINGPGWLFLRAEETGLGLVGVKGQGNQNKRKEIRSRREEDKEQSMNGQKSRAARGRGVGEEQEGGRAFLACVAQILVFLCCSVTLLGGGPGVFDASAL